MSTVAGAAAAASSSAAQASAASAQSGGGPEMAEKILNSDGVHLLKIDYSVVDGQLVYLEYAKLSKKKLNLYTLLSLILSAVVLRYLIKETVDMVMVYLIVFCLTGIVWTIALESMVRNSATCTPIPEVIKKSLPENAEVVSMNFDWYHRVVRVYYVTKRPDPPAPAQTPPPQKPPSPTAT